MTRHCNRRSSVSNVNSFSHAYMDQVAFFFFFFVLTSACSGVVSAVLGTPADVMKTRMMNQPYGPDGKGLLYRSTFNCLVQTVRAE